MNETLMMALGQAGAYAAISLAALGSALGTGAAGAAAVGAWKKCYAQNKPAPFQLAVFAGAPLSQTIYGMIIMFLCMVFFKQPEQWPFFLSLGVIGGIAMGASAWMQGKAAAGSCDAFADTGQGFTNYLMALGIIETVAIFAMAFGIVIMAMAGGFKTDFPVKVAIQKDKAIEEVAPKAETANLAKFTTSFNADDKTALIFDTTKNVTITVYPADVKGNIATGTTPVAITKLTDNANKIALNQILTKDKKSLADGSYIFDIKSGTKNVNLLVQIGKAATK